MGKVMLWKIAIVTLVFLFNGCDTVPENQGAGKLQFSGKSGAVKWVNAGTLVSVRPDLESTRRPGRKASALLGETMFGRTRVETTKGVYVVGDKIMGVVETGSLVSVGYKESDEYPGMPSYLSLGGRQYEIVR